MRAESAARFRACTVPGTATVPAPPVRTTSAVRTSLAAPAVGSAAFGVSWPPQAARPRARLVRIVPSRTGLIVRSPPRRDLSRRPRDDAASMRRPCSAVVRLDSTFPNLGCAAPEWMYCHR